MDYHEYANLFPMMNQDEMRELCADMQSSGYDTTAPIMLYHGMILDGRNRQLAADTVGVVPAYTTFEGDDKQALDFVIRHNLKRRHLNETQRAIVASKLETMKHGQRADLARDANLHVLKREEAAAMLNVSPRTVATVKAIERAAPELIEKMWSGEMTASKATQEVKRAEAINHLENIQVQEVKKAAGVFDVIVIDPPWPMEKIERDVAPNQVKFDYPTMTLEELALLEIPYADDCHIWVWTTQKFLPHTFELLKSWGMKYVCTFVWHKAGGFQPFGLPQYNAEFAIYARRGSPEFVDFKNFKLCFDAPRGAHSEKPEEFYDLVRRVTAGRRLDMFNRRTIEGFETWGNEAC